MKLRAHDIKRICLNLSEAFRQRDADQFAAPIECPCRYDLNTGSDLSAYKTVAVPECAIPDRCYRIRYHQALKRLAVECLLFYCHGSLGDCIFRVLFRFRIIDQRMVFIEQHAVYASVNRISLCHFNLLGKTDASQELRIDLRHGIRYDQFSDSGKD